MRFRIEFKAQNKAQNNQITDREHILLLLKENPSLTQVEISEMMNKSRRAIQMLMKELIAEGVIERIGSKKNGLMDCKIREQFAVFISGRTSKDNEKNSKNNAKAIIMDSSNYCFLNFDLLCLS